MKRLLSVGILAGALALVGGTAEAGILGTTTFDGDVYTLEDLGSNLYKLTVDTDGSTPTNYIRAVAINLGGASSGGSLSTETAPGTWGYVEGGTNSGGCSGSGNAFDCAQWQSGDKAFDDGSIYSWTWQILTPNIVAATDHVKSVYFANATNRFAGLQMSQDLDPFNNTDGGGDDDDSTIPEPATLALMGLGLTAVAAKARRRQPTA